MKDDLNFHTITANCLSDKLMQNEPHEKIKFLDFKGK